MRNGKTMGLMATMLATGALIGLIVASQLQWPSGSLAGNESTITSQAQQPSPPSKRLDLTAASKAYVQVAKQVMPTVVSITSEKVVNASGSLFEYFHEDFFRGRGRRRGEEYRQDGLGSGVIISADGYIVTNNHVIRDAESVVVRIDRHKHKAKVIGSDPKSDLAVIKIETNKLPAAAYGNSDALEVGEIVLAVGNPFSLQLAHSVTAGIVSGIGRTRVGIGEIDYEDFIQTDAAINPGNSGGALVNLNGELVGINTAIVSGGWGGGNVGIGFAIPINLARDVIEQLIANGEVIRGWLGVYIRNVDEEQAANLELAGLDGAVVQSVSPGSPAEKAGLRKDDFITEIDDVGIRDSSHLMNMIARYRPGSEVNVKYFRDGELNATKIKLGRRPEEPQPVLTSNEPPPTLGLTVQELDQSIAEELGLSNDSGILVTGVENGSQAEKEGIQPGDVIREVNRRPVSTVADFRQQVAATKPGKFILLRVIRESGSFFVALKPKNN